MSLTLSLSFSFLRPPFLPSFPPFWHLLHPLVLSHRKQRWPYRAEVRSGAWRRGGGGVDEDLSSLSSPPIPCTMFLKMKVFYNRFRWETAKMQIPEPLKQISKEALESAF